MEEVLKVFVSGRETAAIRCPQCRLVKQVPVTRLEKHRLKVKCACQHVFWLQVEFRKKHRKKTQLAGIFRRITKEELAQVNWEFRGVDRQESNCEIINLSQDGVGFIAKGQHGIAIGDMIELTIPLDDSARTPLVKRALARAVTDNYIGCEFLDEDKNDKKIGFYTLT